VTEADARAFANALVAGDYLTGPVTQTVAAGASEAVAGLAPGYYLIKDRTAPRAARAPPTPALCWRSWGM
jgi:hypothetical protein